MNIAVRFKVPKAAILPVSTVLLGVMLGACASAPRSFGPASLDSPVVSFTSGRVVLALTDEYGLPMARTRVDMSWESPQYYKTSAFTDSDGRVSFSGVPEVAELSIDHPGGNFTRVLMVPQRGTSELPVILDTYGGNLAMREGREATVGPRPLLQ